MLWAETKPVFEARTDFGEIFPVMVFPALTWWSQMSFLQPRVELMKTKGLKLWPNSPKYA